MKTIIITAAMLAAGLSTPAWSQATTGAQFVVMASASDLYEKTSSQSVLKTTKDPNVRSFAQMMIKDHTKSTADVKAAAARSRVRAAPPKLDAEQAQMVADLNAAKGADRDRVYVTQQKAAHEKALALHTGYATDGTEAPLKAVAAATAPVVQHHLEMLNAM